MTRRYKKTRDFAISLEIKREDFIRPPRDAQRNWLLNRAVSELADNLLALDRTAGELVAGSDKLVTADRAQAELSDEQIMEDWQIPLMRAMADAVTVSHGDILEIGFGRGIASALIQDCGVSTHTIIECNEHIIGRFQRWRDSYPDRAIEMLGGMWQDVLPQLGAFDGIFFHTYPLNEDEFIEQIAASTTFAEHFFAHAAAHLHPGGSFTYLSNEIDSLSRGHQRRLFEHFSAIHLSRVDALDIPQDVQDAWWARSMVVVRAIK